MGTWILIVMVYSATVPFNMGKAAAATSAEFGSQELCEAARSTVTASWSDVGKVYAVCVPSGFKRAAEGGK